MKVWANREIGDLGEFDCSRENWQAGWLGVDSKCMAGPSNIFQPPPGTRDFYPEAMALRRYIEDTWRRVSLRHGFVEVDGPTFEYLDLYKVKSGDEIVSQLFHFESRGEDKTEFALRPEFTPTVARMIAAKANSLPRPIKWFSIPRCYRAERPQKGRLREFFQWNVDMLGGEAGETRLQFDLEVAGLCLDCLREFGLGNQEVKLRWNDRKLVESLFRLGGVPDERFAFAFHLLDRVAKLTPEARAKLYGENDVSDREKIFFEKLAAHENPLEESFWQGLDEGRIFERYSGHIAEIQRLIEGSLADMGLPGYAVYDASIVRGLAYYTGFVWEIAATGEGHRAIAGGGRYDKLIEMFGGPSLPATGFGMGDVVLENLLREKGKLPANLFPPADVFVISILEDPTAAQRLLAELRQSKWSDDRSAIVRPGLAAVTSYKATKNIGKLLQDASASGARVAVILAPAEWERGILKVKNLVTREEVELAAGRWWSGCLRCWVSKRLRRDGKDARHFKWCGRGCARAWRDARSPVVPRLGMVERRRAIERQGLVHADLPAPSQTAGFVVGRFSSIIQIDFVEGVFMAMRTQWDAGQVLEAYFLETRAKLLEIAATLDRVDRAADVEAVKGDARIGFIWEALKILQSNSRDRAERIQRLYSKE